LPTWPKAGPIPTGGDKARTAIQSSGRELVHAGNGPRPAARHPPVVARRVAWGRNLPRHPTCPGATAIKHAVATPPANHQSSSPDGRHGGAVVLPRLVLPPLPPRRRLCTGVPYHAAAPGRLLLFPARREDAPAGDQARPGAGAEAARARCLLGGLTQPARCASRGSCRVARLSAARRRRVVCCLCCCGSPLHRAGLAAIDVTIPNATTTGVPDRISVSSLLEVVSDDLLRLNNNLKSVSFLPSLTTSSSF
jgi:hypothetical protein